MLRSLRFAALAFLLLFLQGQALVHPITHLPGKPAQETGIASPQAVETCVECALLAGGFTALHAGLPGAIADAPVDSFLFFSHRSRAGEVPAWFQSRAPPVLP